MRKLALLVLLVGGSACVRREVLLPRSVEANSCRRECMLVYNSCMGSQMTIVNGLMLGPCPDQNFECLSTCPGAEVVVRRQDSASTAQLLRAKYRAEHAAATDGGTSL